VEHERQRGSNIDFVFHNEDMWHRRPENTCCAKQPEGSSSTTLLVIHPSIRPKAKFRAMGRHIIKSQKYLSII
jgi:hypothetical protein